MNRRASLITLGLSLALVGCVKHYRPPKPNEPHAIIKLRRVYEMQTGTTLGEVATIGRDRAFSSWDAAASGTAPKIDAILVHPKPLDLAFNAEFFHQESRQVWETYYQSVPHNTTESYSCGSYSSPRTCTRSVTQYRQEPRQRWVTRVEKIVDAICGSAVSLWPQQGRTYLLQYTFQQSGVCHLACFEQLLGADGEFQNSPCPYAPPAEED